MRLSPIFCIATAIVLGYANLLSAAEQRHGVGLSFSHKDWVLACDNTRTCRAAGYHADSPDQPISVLLTRLAGANQAVSVQVQLGETEQLQKMPSSLNLRINGQSLGNVALDPKTGIGSLDAKQVTALLAVFGKKASITWGLGKQTLVLSDEGAAAVLLKMDEFQGRLGTVGALVRKGNQDESKVLPALPLPKVQAAAIPQAKLSPLSAAQQKQLKADVLKTLGDQANCDVLLDPETHANAEFKRYPLSPQQAVVTTPCWRAAYNSGDGVWLTNYQAPFQPRLVTTDSSDYAKGEITIAQKGRGLGDCWSYSASVWDGKQFVKTRDHTTGLCKGFPGGAWELPTFVSETIPAKP